MNIAVLLPQIASVLIATVLGLRLVLLSRRTGATPELLWGLTWSFYGLTNILETGVFAARDLPFLYAGYCLSYGTTLALLWISTWRVFRPEHRVAEIVALGALALLVCGLIYQGLGPGFDVSAPELATLGTPMQWLMRSMGTAGLFWVSVETAQQYRLARRQLTFGLCAASAPRRMGLWLISGSSLALYFGTLFLTHGLGVAHPLIAMVAQPVLSLAGAVALWIAFLPPASWTDPGPDPEREAD